MAQMVETTVFALEGCVLYLA